MEAWEKFRDLCDRLGSDTILTEVENYFSSDELNDFCESVARDYDVDYWDEEDNEDEDENW